MLDVTTLRIWKAAIHLGGAKTLRHIMWSFWWHAPGLSRGYTPIPTFVGLGSLYMIFSLESAPGCGVSVNPRHIREHGGAGPHYSEVAQVVFSATSRNMCMLCVVCCGCRCRSTYHELHHASARRVIRQPTHLSRA